GAPRARLRLPGPLPPAPGDDLRRGPGRRRVRADRLDVGRALEITGGPAPLLPDGHVACEPCATTTSSSSAPAPATRSSTSGSTTSTSRSPSTAYSSA